MSQPKEARKFYEAERHNVVLSHSDFAYEDNFEYLQETVEFNDFLLSKPWDKYFVTQKSGNVICDIIIVNKVFEECYKKFNKSMDTVQMFYLITNFYNISGSQYFSKLVQSYRMKLVFDLESRIGRMTKYQNVKIGQDKIQLAFKTIFK